jgi:20S proteasome alpha/beta subunit
MTVCIAALCEHREAIILAADRMISTAVFEVEFATSKITRVHPSWWVLMAADYVAPVFSMTEQLKVRLQEADKPTVYDVEQALGAVFQNERVRRAETAVLSPHGMTMNDFISYGRSQLGDVLFERIYTQISYQRLPVWLIATGFDDDGLGHILSVQDPGQVDRHENPGFFAIGAGATNALSMLYYNAQDYTDPVARTLYQTNEAKIFAGFAPGVGWETELIVLRSGQEPRSLSQNEVKRLDSIWQKEGSPRSPKGIETRLKSMVLPLVPGTA